MPALSFKSACLLYCVTLAACGSGNPPDAKFLARPACVVWAGQCQKQTSTAGDLDAACRKAQSTAEWEVLSATKAIFRCQGRDKMTGERADNKFMLEARDEAGDRLLEVTRITINGEDLDQASMLAIVTAMDGAIQDALRR